MTVLVTRPDPDNEATAEALRARGFDVMLAPMLRFVAVGYSDQPDETYDAVLVTSANALRACESAAISEHLLALPLFAVGEQTSEAARRTGFRQVMTANSGSASLRDLVLKSVKGKIIGKQARLLYLAGADLARDLAGELGAQGLTVMTQTTYRMLPTAELPFDVGEAIAMGRIQAVLHYSRRSARAFVEAVRLAGVEISALSIVQGCLSESIAAVLRDAGATRVIIPPRADENALLDGLARALRPAPR